MRVAFPTTLAEACGLLRDSRDPAKLVAGGTAVVLLVQLGVLTVENLVSLRDVTDATGWREINRERDRLHIGAAVLIETIGQSEIVSTQLPSLAEAAGKVGNVRVRNVATLGGALAEADYASDLPAVLLSLDAQVHLSNGQNTRSLSVDQLLYDFYATTLAEDEVITGVEIPLTATPRWSVYRKFCSRSAEDRPCVGVAASATLSEGAVDGLQVVVGAVSGTPQRFEEILAPAQGRPLDDEAIEVIASGYAEAVDPVSDLRGSAWYRRQVVRSEVRRALLGLASAQRGGG